MILYITIFLSICAICATICYISYIRNIYCSDTDVSHVAKLEDIYHRIHHLYEKYIESYAREYEFTSDDARKLFEAIYDIDSMVKQYKFDEN